ncbi:MAG TPA: ECF-type sigma factor [Woeseiaceae bacterium]|nr:ECF-type sigma factor [Woeseiaceae bacterium]
MTGNRNNIGVVPRNNITRLVDAAGRGEAGASDELLPLVYDELRKLAYARMRNERPGHTLQPTALVHEAYLRVVGDNLQWSNRRHFFAAAAEAMRRILVDRARRKAAIRHGGDMQRDDFENVELPAGQDYTQLIEWDEVLDKLHDRDANMADVFKLRYFAGFSIAETADALGISVRTVNRHWTAALTWLRLQIDDGHARCRE